MHLYQAFLRSRTNPGPHTALWAPEPRSCRALLEMGNGTLCLSPLKSLALQGAQVSHGRAIPAFQLCCFGGSSGGCALLAWGHRCPRGHLPMPLTLTGTLVTGAQEPVGTERDTLLLPGHQCPGTGLEPQSHTAKTHTLPSRKALLQHFPQP